MSEPITTTEPAPEEGTVAAPSIGHSEDADVEIGDADVEEDRVCANCGAPAVYESPADGNMDVVLLCSKHKPVNAPK